MGLPLAPPPIKTARDYSKRNLMNQTSQQRGKSFKFLSRKYSFTCSTIEVVECPTVFSHKGKVPIVRPQTSNPFAVDKELARTFEARCSIKKPAIVRNTSTSLNTQDIEGSRPKTFRSISKSYSSLGNDDIDGSKPNYAKKFEKKPPVVSTKVPESYDNGASLVFFGPRLPEKKFLRDPLNRDDIDGAKASNKYEGRKEREIMKYDDIEGTKPSQPHHIKERKESKNKYLDFSDVTAGKKKPIRKFSTNPLNPVYDGDKGMELVDNAIQMDKLNKSQMAVDNAAPPCFLKPLNRQNTDFNESASVFMDEADVPNSHRLKGKRRFDNNKNMTSAKTSTYTTGKPPVYKQTIKRWAY